MSAIESLFASILSVVYRALQIAHWKMFILKYIRRSFKSYVVRLNRVNVGERINQISQSYAAKNIELKKVNPTYNTFSLHKDPRGNIQVVTRRIDYLTVYV